MVVKFIIRRAAHSQVIIYCNFISITILIQRHDRDSRSKKKKMCMCLCCCFNRIRSHPSVTHSQRWFKFHAAIYSVMVLTNHRFGCIDWWHLQFNSSFIPHTQTGSVLIEVLRLDFIYIHNPPETECQF